MNIQSQTRKNNDSPYEKKKGFFSHMSAIGAPLSVRPGGMRSAAGGFRRFKRLQKYKTEFLTSTKRLLKRDAIAASLTRNWAASRPGADRSRAFRQANAVT